MNTLKAERRDLAEKAKKLRREGFVTGNVFGHQIQGSIPLKIVRSELDNDLAQIPMAISIGSHAIETISIPGSQKDWKKISIVLPSVMSFTFYLKIFFAQGGMGIRSCKLSLLESQEGDVADHLSGRQTEAD